MTSRHLTSGMHASVIRGGGLVLTIGTSAAAKTLTVSIRPSPIRLSASYLVSLCSLALSGSSPR